MLSYCRTDGWAEVSAGWASPAGSALPRRGGGVVRQWRLVLLNTGSHTHKMAGMRNRLTRAEMRAPRASMTQMEPMRSMEETKDTPNVAQTAPTRW